MAFFKKILILFSTLATVGCVTTSPNEESTFGFLGNNKEISLGAQTVLGHAIGIANLQSVQTSLGPAYVFQEGQAGNLVRGVCYRGADKTLLAFESGEAGGPEGIVTAIRLIRAGTPYKYSRHCSPSKEVLRSTAFADKTSLMMSRDRLEKKLGSPDKSAKDLLSYKYVSTRKYGTQKEDTVSFVNIKLTKQVPREISVSRAIEIY
ncbi:hypothetical protein [Bdellovibrio bacteriovorus]|uniref:hypothetical protein n=1 Tax=Bdellovibrio bacteriovorus TaxID=959 RepID=UPI0035A5FD06|nr:hypothetical protein HAGR004_16740 [Bdellovibrio sp. HAGR004]